MPKIYTTMQGRRIDVDKLRARNEQVRAIGNMPVNARGDQIGAGGKIVKTREEVAKDYYNTKAYNESNPKAASDVPTRNQTLETVQPTPVAVQTAQPTVEVKKTKTVKKPAVKKAETKTESKSVEPTQTETQPETDTASGIDAAFDE
jgi:outer membrane biosynthesis protein TonB